MNKFTTEDKKFEDTYGKAFVETYEKSVPTSKVYEFGVTNIGESSELEKLRDDVDNLTPEKNLKLTSEGFQQGNVPDIADYNMMTYGVNV